MDMAKLVVVDIDITNDHESYVSEVIDEIFISQFGQNAQLKLYSYDKIGIFLFFDHV